MYCLIKIVVLRLILILLIHNKVHFMRHSTSQLLNLIHTTEWRFCYNLAVIWFRFKRNGLSYKRFKPSVLLRHADWYIVIDISKGLTFLETSVPVTSRHCVTSQNTGILKIQISQELINFTNSYFICCNFGRTPFWPSLHLRNLDKY
jgi:hypothetical protein